MKKLVWFLLFVGAAFIALLKGLWKLAEWIVAVAPVPIAVWTIFMVSVKGWPPTVFWGVFILLVLSIAVWMSRNDANTTSSGNARQIDKIKRHLHMVDER